MTAASSKVALVLGVANHRSIAWACVQRFLANSDFERVILTYQHERFRSTIDKLVASNPRLLSLQCDVETDLPVLFSQALPDVLKDQKINAIVHSVAYASGLELPLSQASWESFAQAQHISSYSLLETAQQASQHQMLTPKASLSTLSYLGAVRAVPNYHVMGPCKASLEALVRGLAFEFGETLRVNAVSAGPLNTLAARGIPNFTTLSQNVANSCPLGRAVTVDEVAETVHFLATAGTGITGQTVYVDGGYNIAIPKQS